jgi:O-antigen/teichoic acid export membrane protein
MKSSANGAEPAAAAVDPSQAPFQLRDFVASGVTFAVGGVLARAATVAVVPIYLRHLGPDEYALQALALVNEQVLIIVSGYAITNALGRFYAEVPRGSAEESRVIRTALYGVAAVSVVACVAVQAVAPLLATATLETGPRGTTIARLIGLSMIGTCLTTLAATVLLLQRRAWAYTAVTGGAQTFAAGLSLAGLIWLPGGLLGLMTGYTVGVLSAGVAAASWLAVRFRAPASPAVARALIQYGLPLVPAALLMLVVNSADKYVLRGFAGLTAVGIYAAAYLAAGAVSLVCITPFRLMWNSLIWNIRRSDDERQTHRYVFEHYLVFQVIVVGLVAASAERMMALVSGGRPEFMAAAWLVPVLYFGFVCLGAADVLSVGYFFESKTGYHLRTVTVAAVVAVTMNVLLVPGLGYAGSALATALSLATLTVLAHTFGRRFFQAEHDWAALVKRLAAVAAVVVPAVAARYLWPGAPGVIVTFTVFTVLLALVARRSIPLFRASR